MQQKLIRAGKHSLAVIIPAYFIHALGIKAGDSVFVTTDMNKASVKITFSGNLQLSFSEGKQK